MYKNHSIVVVVPAFNEERFIRQTIQGIPGFVDKIVVIDDGSHDKTAKICTALQDPRVTVIRHRSNQGVGGAIITGYKYAISHRYDVAVVMAGDGQMDPDDLPALLDPIVDNRADYTKGNRFKHPDVWRIMPKVRIVGNIALSFATKVTSGYWHVFDSQCGYTAVRVAVLSRLDLDSLYKRYGFPNDMLAALHVAGCRVVDVKVRPIYGEQDSGIHPMRTAPKIAAVLVKSLVRRLQHEYLAIFWPHKEKRVRFGRWPDASSCHNDKLP